MNGVHTVLICNLCRYRHNTERSPGTAYIHLRNAVESTEGVWRTLCNSACIYEEDLVLVTFYKTECLYWCYNSSRIICTLYFSSEFDRSFTALFCFLNLQNLCVVWDHIVTICLILVQVKERDGKTCTLY